MTAAAFLIATVAIGCASIIESIDRVKEAFKKQENKEEPKEELKAVSGLWSIKLKEPDTPRSP